MDGPSIRDYIDARKKSGMSWDEFRALKDKNKGGGVSDSDMVAWRKQLDAERERKLNRGSVAESAQKHERKKKSSRKPHENSAREKHLEDRAKRHRSDRHGRDDNEHRRSRRHEHDKDRSRHRHRDVSSDRAETSHRRRSKSPASRKERRKDRDESMNRC